MLSWERIELLKQYFLLLSLGRPMPLAQSYHRLLPGLTVSVRHLMASSCQEL